MGVELLHVVVIGKRPDEKGRSKWPALGKVKTQLRQRLAAESLPPGRDETPNPKTPRTQLPLANGMTVVI
jgi:hypothetical protein